MTPSRRWTSYMAMEAAERRAQRDEDVFDLQLASLRIDGQIAAYAKWIRTQQLVIDALTPDEIEVIQGKD